MKLKATAESATMPWLIRRDTAVPISSRLIRFPFGANPIANPQASSLGLARPRMALRSDNSCLMVQSIMGVCLPRTLRSNENDSVHVIGLAGAKHSVQSLKFIQSL